MKTGVGEKFALVRRVAKGSALVRGVSWRGAFLNGSSGSCQHVRTVNQVRLVGKGSDAAWRGLVGDWRSWFCLLLVTAWTKGIYFPMLGHWGLGVKRRLTVSLREERGCGLAVLLQSLGHELTPAPGVAACAHTCRDSTEYVDPGAAAQECGNSSMRDDSGAASQAAHLHEDTGRCTCRHTREKQSKHAVAAEHSRGRARTGAGREGMQKWSIDVLDDRSRARGHEVSHDDRDHIPITTFENKDAGS